MFQFLAMMPAGCRRSFPRHLLHPIAAPAIWAAAALIAQVIYAQPLKAEQASRPNVLLIMADDLGFSDLGCYGGEIKTPNLDGLAAGGLRYTQFYNTARCWPTRAALLTGYYAQQVGRDTLPGLKRGNRPDWAVLLPSMLRPAGYRSYHSGKWHIDGMPLKNGFDRSYYLQDQGRFFSPKVHYEDDKKLSPVPRGSGYYGTTAIVDHAVRCLKDHAANHGDKPFFHYLAFTAPHFPLHALPQDIARYQGSYDSGWDVARQKRWQRQQQLGIMPAKGSRLSAVERRVGPPYHFPEALKKLGSGEVNRPLPWESLTAEQQTFQAAKMELHAAMIDRLDREIGRVLQQLKEMSAMQNTLIFFLSDNGASAEIMVRTDGHDPAATPGSAASYLCLGPGWSTCSNTPFRRHKTWVHQGGIATPLIVHWPATVKQKGAIRQAVGHVIDIVPTVLEVAEVTRKIRSPQPTPTGVSLLASFSENSRSQSRRLWWAHEGHRALRLGDWKLVAAKDQDWELYDLANDLSETNNLASNEPGLVKQLAEFWQQQADQFRRAPSPP